MIIAPMTRSKDTVLLVASFATSALLVWISHIGIKPVLSQAPLFGVYEPMPSEVQLAPLTMAAHFLDWAEPDTPAVLTGLLAQARRLKRLPLITIEPFHDRGLPEHRRKNLDQEVLAGTYDSVIDAIAEVIRRDNQPLLLRFGHEMEIPNQYPWSWADPKRFISLYRYVYERLAAQETSNLRWVWSPAGDENARLYWPGADAVDLIGVSIYATRSWNLNGELESFRFIYEGRRWLHESFQKPLLVAEMGISGSLEDQEKWLQDAIGAHSSFPELCAVVYFHAPQPLWMPLSTGPEDWSLKPGAIAALLEQLPLPVRPGLSCLED
jgi:beta-mannanase